MIANPYQTILVAIDLSPLADTAVARAVTFANALGRVNKIHVLHVANPGRRWRFAPESGAVPKLGLDAITDAVAHVAMPETSARVTREVTVGAPADEIVLAASKLDADLIVLATHDRSTIARFVLGSVAKDVVRSAPCPVLIVARDRRGPSNLKSVLAAVDLSPISTRVIDEAARIAEFSAGHLTVISAYQEPAAFPGRGTISPSEAERRELRAMYGAALKSRIEIARGRNAELETQVIDGPSVPDAVIDHADSTSADLIVLGTSGHDAWERFILGSTATKIVAGAHCSVLVVPHEEVDARAGELSLVRDTDRRWDWKNRRTTNPCSGV